MRLDLESLVNLDSLDDALPILAKHAEAARTVKQGAWWDDLKGHATGALSAIGNQASSLGGHARGLVNRAGGQSLTNWWDTSAYQPAARNSLIGAAGGAALGGIGSLAFGEKGRRRPLSNMMMGAALGGTLGGGASLAMGHEGRQAVPPTGGTGGAPAVPRLPGVAERLGIKPPPEGVIRDPQTEIARLRTQLPAQAASLEDQLQLSGTNRLLGSYDPLLRLRTAANALGDRRYQDFASTLVPDPDTLRTHQGMHAGAIPAVAAGQAAYRVATTPNLVRAANPDSPISRMSGWDINRSQAANWLPWGGNSVVAGDVLSPETLTHLTGGAAPTVAGLRAALGNTSSPEISALPTGAADRLRALVASPTAEAELQHAMTGSRWMPRFMGGAAPGVPLANAVTRRQLGTAVSTARGPMRWLGATVPHLLGQYYVNQVGSAQNLQAAGATPELLQGVQDLRSSLRPAPTGGGGGAPSEPELRQLLQQLQSQSTLLQQLRNNAIRR